MLLPKSTLLILWRQILKTILSILWNQKTKVSDTNPVSKTQKQKFCNIKKTQTLHSEFLHIEHNRQPLHFDANQNKKDIKQNAQWFE